MRNTPGQLKTWDSVMDEILTKIGCDMTKTVFCKRLVEFGELMGEHENRGFPQKISNP